MSSLFQLVLKHQVHNIFKDDGLYVHRVERRRDHCCWTVSSNTAVSFQYHFPLYTVAIEKGTQECVAVTDAPSEKSVGKYMTYVCICNICYCLKHWLHT